MEKKEEVIKSEDLSPFELLKAPCSADEIDWKQDSKPEKHKLNWARYVPYVDARALMERLDKAFDHFWSVDTKYMGKNGKGTDMYMSTISVQVSKDNVISRNDWAEDTDIAQIKGGASNAFKRAGTQFGFGRELYSYPTVFVQFEGKWAPFGIDKLFDYVAELFIQGKVSNSDKLVIVEHKDGGKKKMKLHFVEYGKPGREIHGGAAPTEPQAVEPIVEEESPYSETEILENLYAPTQGKIVADLEKNVLKSWKNKADGKQHLINGTAYIYTVNVNDGSKIWFVLNDYQRTRIFK